MAWVTTQWYFWDVSGQVSVKLRQQWQHLLHCAASPTSRRFKRTKPLVMVPPGKDISSQSHFPSGFLLQKVGDRATYHPASNPEMGHSSTGSKSLSIILTQYLRNLVLAHDSKPGFGKILELFCRCPRVQDLNKRAAKIRPRALPRTNPMRTLILLMVVNRSFGWFGLYIAFNCNGPVFSSQRLKIV